MGSYHENSAIYNLLTFLTGIFFRLLLIDFYRKEFIDIHKENSLSFINISYNSGLALILILYR